MKANPSFFTKYQLPLFLFLTYALSWWSAPLTNGQLIPYGPALAAIVVLAVTMGRPGLRALWKRISQWRIPITWFLAGPVIILSYHTAALVANLLLGAKLANLPQLSWGIFLELFLIGGLWEELGWSGYLLPKMQQRFADRPNGLLLAAVVTGVFRSIWHLPLFLYGHIPWFDILVFSFAFQLIIAWVFYRSGGSVLAVMLLHFVSNLMGSFSYPLFEGAAHTTYTVLFMVVACLAAFLLIFSGGFSQRQRSVQVTV
jgi:membrane protease YdiL (CAAX protease family)